MIQRQVVVINNNGSYFKELADMPFFPIPNRIKQTSNTDIHKGLPAKSEQPF